MLHQVSSSYFSFAPFMTDQTKTNLRQHNATKVLLSFLGTCNSPRKPGNFRSPVPAWPDLPVWSNHAVVRDTCTDEVISAKVGIRSGIGWGKDNLSFILGFSSFPNSPNILPIRVNYLWFYFCSFLFAIVRFFCIMFVEGNCFFE